jgi:hypothetical protein
MAEGYPIRIIPHRGVDDDCGSLEVWFADGRESVRFYWDNLVTRRLRPELLTRDQAVENATALARAEMDKLDKSGTGESRVLIRNIMLGRPEKLDTKKLRRYRQALRRGDTFPPIDVIERRPGLYEVLDGYHRLCAHRDEGRKTIAIRVVVE